MILLSSLLLLSACSSEPGSSPANHAGASASESGGTPKTGEPVTLNSVFLASTWGTSVQELAKQYEKETGVKVNVELVGRDVIYQKIATSIAGKANYDLFSVDYNWIPEFASQNSLVPLDDMIKTYHFDTSKLLPKALAAGQWNGKKTVLSAKAARFTVYRKRYILICSGTVRIYSIMRPLSKNLKPSTDMIWLLRKR